MIVAACSDKTTLPCSVIQEEDLVTILKLPVLVVLDEAYIEFSDEPSRAGWVRTHNNLIVLRTFSKRAGERRRKTPPTSSSTSGPESVGRFVGCRRAVNLLRL